MNATDGEQTQETDDKKESKKSSWGKGVPLVSAPEMETYIKRVAQQGGEEGQVDALSKVIGYSTKSSSFQVRYAALKIFKTITAPTKDTYKLTDIGITIARPGSKEHEKIAIQNALINNPHFKAIWEKYRGQLLPQDQQYIANTISTTLQIDTDLAQKWSEYFVQAVKFSGLASEREKSGAWQVHSSIAEIRGGTDVKPHEEKPSDIVSPPPPVDPPPPKPRGDMPFDTVAAGMTLRTPVSGNREAIFYVPSGLQQSDIDAIKSLLKGVEIMLDGLKSSQ